MTPRTSARIDSSVDSKTTAVVIGLTIHGLALTRALSKEGVQVICLVDKEAASTPPTLTKYGKVIAHSGLNTASIVQALLDVASHVNSSGPIVLFPTSDSMVRHIGENWGQLCSRYTVSWNASLSRILAMQTKSHVHQHCKAHDILHPKSILIRSVEEASSSLTSDLSFPLVVKPVVPLATFKAEKVHDVDSLHKFIASVEHELPLIVQEWIDGPDTGLVGYTAFAIEGEVARAMCYRKLASYPPLVGQGTVIASEHVPEICEVSELFIRSAQLTGPVAIEYKESYSGRYYLIEPNVGRTEHCVDLTIQAGVNLPYIEYLYATKGLAPKASVGTAKKLVWFDTEKDPMSFIRYFLKDPVLKRGNPVFPYLLHSDTKPFAASCYRLLKNQIARVKAI